MTAAIATLVLVLAAFVAVAHLLQLAAIAYAAIEVRRQRRASSRALREAALTAGELPGISAVVALDGSAAAATRVLDALLDTGYPTLEIILVLDGARGDAFEALRTRFALQPADPRPRGVIPTQHVRAIFTVRDEPRLVVVDKRGVDRADGWNAGLNLATQPLLLTLSPAIVPDRDSLAKAALPFALDPTTIAGFGLVRASAGGGRRAADVPTTVVGGLQHLGASRRALSALVLNPWNAQAGTESGFGLYARDALLNAGGFQPYDAQPGAEMAIRLHGLWRQAGEPYRILQSAWTLGARSAAEGWQELAADEVGRYRSRMELLALHRGTLARSGAGALRTLLLPATLVELVVPLVELVGWLITIGGLATGSVPLDTALLFVASTLGLGLAVSLGSLLVNVACLGIPPALGSTLVLSGLALLDQVGPRQLLHLARLRAWLGPARPAAAA